MFSFALADPSEISDDLESSLVDRYQPDMQQLVPLIVEQLRLGNISEQEQETLARIFEDTWPLMVEEATRTDDRRIDAQMQGIVENLNSLV